MKLPSMQWYPGDWLKDPGVNALSYQDQGIWFRILMHMFEGEQRGKLTLNGHAMPVEALARLLGLDNQILTTTLTTLLTYGVASVEPETGIIFNRRMVRDEEIRNIRVESGKKGGNPVLLNQKSNQTPTTGVKVLPTPSSSSSSSTSVKKNNTTAKRAERIEPESFDGADPTQLIRDAIEKCAEFWPGIGDKRRAASEWEREAAKSTKGVPGWCSAIVETAKTHAFAHVAAKSLSRKHFIPTLERWVSSGDYTSPPPKVIHQQYGPVDLGENLDGRT